MQDDLERVSRVLFGEPAILPRFDAISRHISADDIERYRDSPCIAALQKEPIVP